MRAPSQYFATTTPSAASAASVIVSTIPGQLTQFQVINGAAAQRYLQFFDATALPADGTAPTYEFPVGASATVNLPGTLTFAVGCVACLSSTAPTKTITAADSSFSSTFKSASTPTASAVLASGPCTLEYAAIVNNSGSDRIYVLNDNTSAPALTAAGASTGPTGIRSPRIAAGATWTPFPTDAVKGSGFSKGCVLLSFAFGPNGPDFSALSSADATVTAWFGGTT